MYLSSDLKEIRVTSKLARMKTVLFTASYKSFKPIL